MGTADTLRQARRHAGLTQTELADRAGTSQPAVSAYESGVRSPSMATLERLLAACGKRVLLTMVDREAPAGTGPVGELVRLRRRELRQAFADLGARNPRLFGSVARGLDRPDSDVDLLVDLRRPSYVLLAQVQHAAEQVLGIPVDVSTSELLREEIRETVLAEAVPL